MNAPTEWPSFSIVVPTFERCEQVCAAVSSLAAIEYDGPFEAIVVIDGSTDGTHAALARLECAIPLRIVTQDNRGAAAARNAGAAEARGEILLFLDDDMTCRTDILKAHAHSYATGADAVLGDVPLDPASPPGPLSRAVGKWAAQRREELCAGRELRIEDFLTGQLSVRREVFEALGGFDTLFTAGGTFGNEDVDFGLRLLERYRIVFNPDAVSWQHYTVTPRRYLRQWREVGRADVALARKHPARSAEIRAQFGLRPVTRRLARVPGLASAIGAFAAMLAGALPGEGYLGRSSGRLLSVARDLAYLRGVREARQGDGTLLVLCYHAIADLSGDPVLAQYGCPPDRFAAQLDDLVAQGFHFVGPDDLLGFLGGTAKLPRDPVLLTFDDCYAELPDVARQILRPRGIPALAFAVAGLIGKSNEWDQPAGARSLALADAAGLARLAECGIEIGSHSMSHAELANLDAEGLARETAGAAQALANLGLHRPRFFAYPYGDSDPQSRAAVIAAGYRAAFVLGDRRAAPDDDRFCIPRVEIFAADHGRRFAMRTSRSGAIRRSWPTRLNAKAGNWVARQMKRAASIVRTIAP